MKQIGRPAPLPWTISGADVGGDSSRSWLISRSCKSLVHHGHVSAQVHVHSEGIRTERAAVHFHGGMSRHTGLHDRQHHVTTRLLPCHAEAMQPGTPGRPAASVSGRRHASSTSPPVRISARQTAPPRVCSSPRQTARPHSRLPSVKRPMTRAYPRRPSVHRSSARRPPRRPSAAVSGRAAPVSSFPSRKEGTRSASHYCSWCK